MIRVDMRRVDGEKRGDCFTCCLASLLNLPYEEVPMFVDLGEIWSDELHSFLAKHGYEFCGSGILADLETYKGINGLFIVGGKSPRGNWGHAVIYQTGGKLFFDPHPSRAGINEIWDVYMIEPTESVPKEEL